MPSTTPQQKQPAVPALDPKQKAAFLGILQLLVKQLQTADRMGADALAKSARALVAFPDSVAPPPATSDVFTSAMNFWNGQMGKTLPRLLSDHPEMTKKWQDAMRSAGGGRKRRYQAAYNNAEAGVAASAPQWITYWHDLRGPTKDRATKEHPYGTGTPGVRTLSAAVQRAATIAAGTAASVAQKPALVSKLTNAVEQAQAEAQARRDAQKAAEAARQNGGTGNGKAAAGDSGEVVGINWTVVGIVGAVVVVLVVVLALTGK